MQYAVCSLPSAFCTAYLSKNQHFIAKSLGERISINGVGNTKISLHIILLIESQKRIKIKNKILFNRGI